MNNFENAKILSFPELGDDRGHLVVMESGKEIPFIVRRVFYIYGSDSSVVRGQHANIKSEFVLINIVGQSKVKIKDGKGNEKIFLLDKPHTGIYLPKMIWKDMYDFSEDSVLLVLSNEEYDPNEYIRNFDDFTKKLHDLDN